VATLGSITVPAKKLQEAVSVAIPSDFKRTWRKKVWPVNLAYNRKQKLFSVIEARHELAAFDIPVLGKWPAGGSRLGCRSHIIGIPTVFCLPIRNYAFPIAAISKRPNHLRKTLVSR
jgi:hypothetical protein